MTLKTFVDPELFSVLAQGIRVNGDPYLASGNHLRWTLSPDLGVPRRGFVVKRRASPVWPWRKDESVPVSFHAKGIATSVRGVHSTYTPLLAEGAQYNRDETLSGATITFRYERREQTDPQRAPWIRLAVLLRATELQSTITMTARSLHQDGAFVVARFEEAIGRLPFAFSPSRPERVAIITAPAMDEVVLRLPRDAKITQVHYVDAVTYAELDDWDTIATLAAPVDGDGRTLPRMPNLAATVKSRLRRARPLRYVGVPARLGDLPPLASVQDHDSFENSLITALPEISRILASALKEEIEAPRPPGQIMLEDLSNLAAVDGAPGSAAGGFQAPVHAILAASAQDPAIAAILGLAYRDTPPNASVGYDYAVEAVLPVIWLGLVMSGRDLPAKMQPLAQGYLVPPLAGDLPDATARFFGRLVGLAPDIWPRRYAPAPAPHLGIETVGQPASRPVAAAAHLHIMASPDIRPGSLPARTLVWRQDRRAQTALNERHPLTRHLIPFAAREPGSPIVDSALQELGTTTYRVQSIDLFGRGSAIATQAVEIVDSVPPPAPTGLRLKIGAPSSALNFPNAEVSFIWTRGAQQQAPDLAEFKIFWKAGYHAADTIIAAPDGRLTEAWPAPSAVQAIVEGGTLLTLALGPARALQNGPRAEVSAVVVACDRAGNVSPPSLVAHAFHYAEDRPPALRQPGDVMYASWPDARNLCWWRCRWPARNPGSFVRLSSVQETRLIRLAGMDRAAHMALPVADRAARLRALAIAYPQAFAPETAQALPHTVTKADVSIPGDSESLKVVVVEYIGATGEKADWPTTEQAFAVIAARPGRALAPPRVTLEADAATITITLGTSLPTPCDFHLYRVTQAGQDLRAVFPDFVVARSEAPVLVDRAAPKDQWVGYSAVSIGPDGRRSDFSPVVWTRMKQSL